MLRGGTVNSPQLLMLSGVGPSAHLTSLGIPLVLDAPEVGRNLQNHPSYSLRFTVPQPVTAYKYLNRAEQSGRGCACTRPDRRWLARRSLCRDRRIHAQRPVAGRLRYDCGDDPGAVTRSGVGFRLRDLFPERHGFTVLVGSGRPLSRGHILLRNADPTTHPLIFPEYFSEPEDLHSLARSVQRMRDMMGASAMRDLIEQSLLPARSPTTR